MYSDTYAVKGIFYQVATTPQTFGQTRTAIGKFQDWEFPGQPLNKIGRTDIHCDAASAFF